MITCYWKGDKAKYTGKSELVHGQECFELKLLEGHRKGYVVWTYRKPGEHSATFAGDSAV